MTNTGIRAEQLKELTGNDLVYNRDVVSMSQFMASVNKVFTSQDDKHKMIKSVELDLEQQISNVILLLSNMDVENRLKYFQIVTKDLRDNVQQSILDLESKTRLSSKISIKFNTVKDFWRCPVKDSLTELIQDKIKEYVSDDNLRFDYWVSPDPNPLHENKICFHIKHSKLSPCKDAQSLIEDIEQDVRQIINDFTSQHDSI